MFKTILALVAGSIILIGAIRRIQTIDSLEFVTTVRVTVFLFAAFAIGLFIVDTGVARTLALELMPGTVQADVASISWLTLGSFVLLPAIYQIIGGRRFADVWGYLRSWWMVPLGVYLATLMAHIVADDFDLGVQAMQVVWFVGLAAILGFAHAVFGPVLAAFNISLIVASVIGTGVLSVSLVDVFEWLGHLGIYSEAMKWILLVGSTTLGLHGTVSLSALKNWVPGS